MEKINSLKTQPKDFFLHLLAIITLYASAIAFTTLIFQYINLWLPDVLEDYYYLGARGLARGALATLIVVFPIFLYTNRHLNKEYKVNPEKRSLRIRKWLIYFTLFVAAIILIVDLVALVRNFLEGELTLRFGLKVLTVGFVTGSIFGYYLNDVKKDKAQNQPE